MPLVVHITPLLPPQNSGVGDYAMLVGRRMEELGGVRCAYVAAGHCPVEDPVDGPTLRNISGCCDAGALWQAVGELAEGEKGRGGEGESRNCSVVLHYSGYGFDRNGAPVWLANALQERPFWVERVVTYFHELYATGKPWQRAFWYSARQRKVAAEIACRSDSIATNCRKFARWLETQTRRQPDSIKTLPVPSNVGEPAEVPPLKERPPRAVAFGGARSKRFALHDVASQVAPLLKSWGIEEMADIGADCPVNHRAYERAGIRVRRLGYLRGCDVSRELIECRLGFLDYPLEVLGKSGVFAAFAAHGVVPLVAHVDMTAADGLIAGVHLFDLGNASRVDQSRLAAASAAIFDWYQPHDSRRHAAAIAALAFKLTSSAVCVQ